jgi:hypothetical protein
MNFIMKNSAIQDTIISISNQEDFFWAILDDRNKHLVNTIIESKENKILILYGMLHFDGVLKLLQEKDPNWHVVDTKFEYPIK